MSDTNWVYTENVKEHFMNPKNILDNIEEYQYDGYGKTGNIQCGDEMLFVIKVKDGKIADCKWKTYGCASAIASTSKLSEMVIGMTLDEAYHISPQDVVKALGGLPDKKIHCSVLGDRALRAALDDYYAKNGMEDKIKKEETQIVCNCMNVTDKDIEDAVLEGARDYKSLQEMTKLGTVCGSCKDEALTVMQEYVEKYFEK